MRIAWFFALLFVTQAGLADDEPPAPMGTHYEIWLGMSSWPALGDLQPAASGEFDNVGFGVGGAIHWPVAQFDESDLLLGIDGYIGATGSNSRGFIGDMHARQLYLGGAVRWAFGERRNIFADAGLGYYLVDIAEVSDDWPGGEDEAWQASRVAASLGLSWDVGAGRDGRRSGWMLGIKAYYADLGTVHDEDGFGLPMLGTDAGRLDGLAYLLQVGYSGR